LYQEVWQSGKLYEYDTLNLDDVKTLAGPLSDGWGITTDNKSLILSDGSSSLSFVDPATLTVQRTVLVCD
jgi:glutamine cyclotransferase